MKTGATYTTDYTTRNGNGSVTITAEKKSYTASFDGLNPINVNMGHDKGRSFLMINLQDLHNVGFNCPDLDKEAAIVMPLLADRKKHMEMIKSFQEEKEKGKYCGDGLWRTYRDISKMNYSEQVLAGEYTE